MVALLIGIAFVALPWTLVDALGLPLGLGTYGATFAFW